MDASEIKELKRLIERDNLAIKALEQNNADVQEWISVTERMPEEHEWIGTKQFGTTISDEVYVTFKTPDGDYFVKHLSFQNGKLSGFDQRTIDAFYKGSIPVAWMPPPKPWKGDETGEAKTKYSKSRQFAKDAMNKVMDEYRKMAVDWDAMIREIVGAPYITMIDGGVYAHRRLVLEIINKYRNGGTA